MVRPLLFLPLLAIILSIGGVEAVRTCMSCAKPGQPTWCSRLGQGLGKVKQCQTGTCFKAVHRKTGEVTKGCAPPAYDHGFNQRISTGFNGDPAVTTYLCNTNYCNSGSSVGPLFALLTASLAALVL